MRSVSWAASWACRSTWSPASPSPDRVWPSASSGRSPRRRRIPSALADAIYRQEIAAAGEDKNINQYFAVLTNTRSVGVMGDGRTYDYTLALRAVTTSDFMTADWARIPYDVLDKISVRIVNQVPGINRIVYDITSKPPATIEWE